MGYADYEIGNLPLSGRVLNRNGKGGTSGTRYVQRSIKSREVKAQGRLRCLETFGIDEFPSKLTILTFPSTNWIFEGMLINNRNRGSGWKYMRSPVGRHTMLVGIEREEAIYRSALNLIPSVKHGLRVKDSPPYATSSLRTFAVKRYLRCDFEDMARSIVNADCDDLKFNGAWLDFNGFINMARKEAIECFLRNHTNGFCRLVITSQDARYDKASMEFWGADRLVSMEAWLKNLGGKILYTARYKSGVAMIEIAADMRRTHRIGDNNG